MAAASGVGAHSVDITYRVRPGIDELLGSAQLISLKPRTRPPTDDLDVLLRHRWSSIPLRHRQRASARRAALRLLALLQPLAAPLLLLALGEHPHEQRDHHEHERERLLDHHDHAADVLVLDRVEAPDAGRLLVVGVERGRAPGQVEPERRQPGLRGGDVAERLEPRHAAAHRDGLDERPPERHPGREEGGVLQQVDERVLGRRVVERRHVPEVHDRQPDGDARGRVGERAERPLHPHQPARGGPHDRAGEAQEDQERRDVAQQHVLDHVRREEVVLAEAVDRGDERGEQREHPGGEGDRLERPGAAGRTTARGGLAAHLEEAPDVDPREQRQRREHGGIREPLDMRMARRFVTGHARDCRNGVPTRRTRGVELGRCLPRSSPRRSAGPVAPTPRAGALSAGAAGGALVFLPREPVCLAGVRVWAPVAYEGPGRDLVRALKFHGALSLAREMSALAVASAPEGLLRGALVPVPLHPVRLRRRGFNQAAVLAGGDRARDRPRAVRIACAAADRARHRSAAAAAPGSPAPPARSSRVRGCRPWR